MRNIRLLFSLDLHEEHWRLFMMEKSIRGIGRYAQERDPALAGALPEPKPRSALNAHEFKIFSQNGEDGALLWLISKVGAPHKTFVEFGIGSGRECNTANLVLNFGWRGLMMDGSARNVRHARDFFKYLMPYRDYAALDIRQTFVTKENINGLIASSAAAKDADILSIDIDGNDYWIWDAITAIEPRIAVIEYNSAFGPDRGITIPYRSDFDAYSEDPLGLYRGASLAALVKLGKKKGYRFVGCESFGANAFFVKDAFAGDIPAADPRTAFYENEHSSKRGSVEEQFARIKDRAFVEV